MSTHNTLIFSWRKKKKKKEKKANIFGSYLFRAMQFLTSLKLHGTCICNIIHSCPLAKGYIFI